MTDETPPSEPPAEAPPESPATPPEPAAAAQDAPRPALPSIRVLPPKATRITRLILDGFKSFAKRTELVMGDDLNIVLGPNGSGKSNVIDALCFVLGRISAKSMRAEKSANLIYNGGKTKQGSKSAEVSICFDNTKRVFPLEEDEIKVSRIVRANGNNVYKINGQTRTRQEVLELLGNAYVDPDGYNIILQGDIVHFVEMSPLERRQIVEGIAGIGVYEEKKQQALRDLEKVDERVKEADTILRERAGYLRDLKKDRDQALKHKELTDKIKICKASHLRRKIDARNDDLASLAKKSETHKQALAKLQDAQQKLRAEMDERKEQITAISKEIEAKGEVENIQLQKDIETIRINLATHKTRISAVRNSIGGIQKRRDELKTNLTDVEAKLTKLAERLEEIAGREDFLRKEQQQLDSALVEFRRKNRLDDSDQMSHTILELDSKAEELAQQAQGLRETHQGLIREKDKIDFQIQTMDDKIAKVKEIEDQHKAELEDLKRKKNEFKKTVLELNELLNKDSKDAGTLADAKRSIQSLQEDLAKLEIKQASIREVVGGNIAVQKVLANKAKLGEIYGTVAELGEVENKYAVALEVAAAQRMQSVVVEDDKTAADCIKYLKTGKFGQATFLPLNKIKPILIEDRLRPLAKERGVHGFAIDLVEFDPKFKTVFQHVLGTTLVVDSIETARRVGVGKVRMVTLDGDLTEFSGAMTGGHRVKREGAFKEKEIGAKIERVREELADKQSTISRLEGQRKASEEKVARFRELKAQLEGDIIKQERALHLDTDDFDASKDYKQQLTQRREDIEAQMRTLEDTIAQKTEDATQLKIKKQQLRDQMTQLRSPTLIAELNAFETKRKQIHEETVTLHAERKQLEGNRADILGPEQRKIGEVLKEMDKEEAGFQKEIEDLESLCDTQGKELKQKEKVQETFMSQFKSLFEKRNTLSDEITARERKLLGVDQEARQEELVLNTHSIEEARLKAELAGLTTEFELYTGIEIDTKTSEEKLKERVTEYEKQVIEIGTVNLRALEIYDIAEREYQSLQEKRGKLDSEKNSVLGMINEIEGNKKELFLRAYDVVNTNFRDIFSQLFSKGNAGLELENQQSPLDGGVSIKVNLVGDKFLDIRSLSGGEKTLTALAFIFAIQEHAPAPFYVLDEVDAALDKHNSTKLAKLYRKYTSRSQYIVISHNDNVIEEGDVLWGVSMPNKETLVSTAVSLRL